MICLKFSLEYCIDYVRFSLLVDFEKLWCYPISIQYFFTRISQSCSEKEAEKCDWPCLLLKP